MKKFFNEATKELNDKNDLTLGNIQKDIDEVLMSNYIVNNDINKSNININNSSDYEETLTIKDFENLKNINDNHSHNHNSVINMESKSYNILSIFKMDFIKTNYSESN